MLKYHAEHNHFVVGVPARDLSDEEVEQYGGRAYLLSTGCYIDEDQPGPVQLVDLPAPVPQVQVGDPDNIPAPNGKPKKSSTKSQ